MNDLRSFPTPRYQAIHFSGLGTVFDAVTDDGKSHTIAGVGTCRDWTICDCRRYAREGGFTDERIFRNDTGQTCFHWYKS